MNDIANLVIQYIWQGPIQGPPVVIPQSPHSGSHHLLQENLSPSCLVSGLGAWPIFKIHCDSAMGSLKKQRSDCVTYSILNKNLLQLYWESQSVNMAQKIAHDLDPPISSLLPCAVWIIQNCSRSQTVSHLFIQGFNLIFFTWVLYPPPHTSSFFRINSALANSKESLLTFLHWNSSQISFMCPVFVFPK